MKKLYVFIMCLFVSISYSQISFTLNSNLCSGTSKILTANTGTDVVLSYTWSSTPAIPVFSSPNSTTSTITFPSTGTFTISLDVTLSIGSGSYSTIVNVASSPTVLVTQSGYTTCMASNYPQYSHPIFLTASGGSTSYSWTPYYSGIGITTLSSIFVRPYVNTCYTVSSIVGSCIGSAVSCVSVIPQFSMAVSPPSSTICLNDSLHLSISNVSTLAVLPIQNYLWYDPVPLSIVNPYNPTATIFPTLSSTYSVEIFDNNACVSLPTLVNVTVASCTGFHSNSLDNNSVLIYPNPANGILNIEIVTLSRIEANYKIEIINTLGQIVQTTNIQNQITILNISALQTGIYFLQIIDTDKLIGSQKIIKE